MNLVDRVVAGERLAIARMISRLESNEPAAREELSALYARSGQAHLVGITGAPGAGKSTLVSALVKCLRAQGNRVGVIAIDPSSPYSGGAILGDRIRMLEHTGDRGVFVRSMASRGRLGGLSRATYEATVVLDAAGMDVVIIETVGVGQDEVDIARAAHTVVVVSIPGTGDDIQALKAGILEIADVHVVNKADRDGANRTIAELRSMLEIARPVDLGMWSIPVLSTVAATGEGVEQLAGQLAEHRTWQKATGAGHERERQIATNRILGVAEELLAERLRDPVLASELDHVVEDVQQRRIDPLRAAGHLLSRIS